jgi:hypothetical protein
MKIISQANFFGRARNTFIYGLLEILGVIPIAIPLPLILSSSSFETSIMGRGETMFMSGGM